ncbi:hypothetical protein F5B20DRAFT_565822 [Whalleya microplaca]|nr:hypothetical protein F5B20DRAFT_565822 [Whalleya microplaca]
MEKSGILTHVIGSFLTSAFFDICHKMKVHIAQITLIMVVISLTVARVATKPSGVPTTRSDTIGIAMVRPSMNA